MSLFGDIIRKQTKRSWAWWHRSQIIEPQSSPLQSKFKTKLGNLDTVLKKYKRSRGCSSVVGQFLRICESLNLIPVPQNKKKKRRKRKGEPFAYSVPLVIIIIDSWDDNLAISFIGLNQKVSSEMLKHPVEWGWCCLETRTGPFRFNRKKQFLHLNHVCIYIKKHDKLFYSSSALPNSQ